MEKESAKLDYIKYIEFVNNFYQYLNDLQKKYADFCDSCVTDDYIAKIEEIKKTYGMLDKDTFNIFTPLKKYEKEDFNEIVLTQILDPRTKEIGNIAFLNKFCKYFIERNEYEFGNDVIVENQKGKIDILIHDDNKAVIVESKIHDAPDQRDQLARYFIYVEKTLKKKVLGIIYIRPIYNENKMPPFDTYDPKYARETAEVKKLLVPVTIIDTNRNKDLCGFLDECSFIAENEKDEKAKIYIKQYSELLKLKGGKKMLINVEKEMLEKLYSDSESVKKMQVITEVYENRLEILASIIKDSLYKKGFGPADGDKNCTAKSINEKISVVFNDYEGDNWGFGFYYKEDTPKNIQKSLENLLENYNNNLLDNDIGNVDNWLIARSFSIEIDRPINDIVNTINKMYKDLEEKAVDILK